MLAQFFATAPDLRPNKWCQ